MQSAPNSQRGGKNHNNQGNSVSNVNSQENFTSIHVCCEDDDNSFSEGCEEEAHSKIEREAIQIKLLLLGGKEQQQQQLKKKRPVTELRNKGGHHHHHHYHH